jgi:hypothetical protein
VQQQSVLKRPAFPAFATANYKHIGLLMSFRN